MEPTKFSTEVNEISAVVDQKVKAEQLLNWQQQTWVEFNAVGGLLIEADGSFKKSPRNPEKNYSVQDLANDLDVDRTTLYNWTRSIPDFWGRVQKERKELGSRARVQKVWNGVFLKAAAGNPQAAAMFLANFDDDFRMPMQKVEHEVGSSWSKLMGIAETNTNKIIEGHVVDAQNSEDV